MFCPQIKVINASTVNICIPTTTSLLIKHALRTTRKHSMSSFANIIRARVDNYISWYSSVVITDSCHKFKWDSCKPPPLKLWNGQVITFQSFVWTQLLIHNQSYKLLIYLYSVSKRGPRFYITPEKKEITKCKTISLTINRSRNT